MSDRSPLPGDSEAPARLGHRIVRLEEVTSTNTLILENESWLDTHGLVVTAKHQTAGRGRLGRKWASLPGAQVQCSTVVHWRGGPEGVGLVSLAAGLSVAESIEACSPLSPRLKWPNDVLVGGRKVCGILIESKPGAAGMPRLVIGIGINVVGAPEDFPPELRERLTTLSAEAGETIDAEALFSTVLTRLDHNLATLQRGERQGVLEAWRAHADLHGRLVRVTSGNRVSEGRAVDIDADGTLLVEAADGTRTRHVSGEVQWLDA